MDLGAGRGSASCAGDAKPRFRRQAEGAVGFRGGLACLLGVVLGIWWLGGFVMGLSGGRLKSLGLSGALYPRRGLFHMLASVARQRCFKRIMEVP